MFKNLFGLKKKSDEIKIAEEESQMTQDFEQASLEDFKILESEEAIEVLTMPDYGQHSEDLHIDIASVHSTEDEPEVIVENPIYPIHNGIPPDWSDDYLFTNSQIKKTIIAWCDESVDHIFSYAFVKRTFTFRVHCAKHMIVIKF
jgi:hypothetical protein